MVLPTPLAAANQAAVAAVKQGQHQEALFLFHKLLEQLHKRHLTHADLFIVYSNKAACHLALQQYEQALQDARQCIQLLAKASARAGLSGGPSRHPHWPKACQRLGRALAGLGQHRQAAAVFEAGLATDPLNPTLKEGLQCSEQGYLQDLLDGKTLSRKALPAPSTPHRITLAPHNCPKTVLQSSSATAAKNSAKPCTLGPGQCYQTGWQGRVEDVVELAQSGELVAGGISANTSSASWQLPRHLLTPDVALADAAMKDVYEFLTTRCNTVAPKKHLYRQLADSPRMSAWWAATTAAVRAVLASGRVCRVLLLGAKTGVLAVAAARAGAAHVTCVEQCPHLAMACCEVMLANGLHPTTFKVVNKSPISLKLGQDLPLVFNCLIADIIDDGVLSGGFIPAVAHALDELLVRDDPVIVPAAVTVMAQAAGVRPSGCAVACLHDTGADATTDDLHDSTKGLGQAQWLKLSALDQYRWTPSPCLPSPLEPSAFQPLSAPVTVWHMPSAAVVKDKSSVQHLDIELLSGGNWSAVLAWAELLLFGDISITTAGRWQAHAIQPCVGTTSHTDICNNCSWISNNLRGTTNNSISLPMSIGSSTMTAPSRRLPSHQPSIFWLEGSMCVSAGDVYPLIACHNTVRMSFTLKNAEYQYLHVQEPSFPHTQFAMAADQHRLGAYAAALKTTLSKVAAAKLLPQQQQQQQQQGLSSHLQASGCSVDVHVLDVGCGSGALSMLAAKAAAGVGLLTEAEAASVTSQHATGITVSSTDAVAGAADTGLSAVIAAAAPVLDKVADGLSTNVPQPIASVKASVVGVELCGPVAAAARRNVAANGCSSVVSIVHGDAAKLERGIEVHRQGVDVVVFDMFDSGLIGHQALYLIEVVKAKLLAEGGQVVPGSATMYLMGVEMLKASSWCSQHSTNTHTEQSGLMAADAGKHGCQACQEQLVSVDLSALDRFWWSDEPETVLLDHLPHKPLTRPVKVFDFDFCQPAGTPYPSEARMQLEVVAEGRVNAVVMWFDLHLAEGVSITSAPSAFTTGGRTDDAGVGQYTTTNSTPGATTHLLQQQQRASVISSCSGAAARANTAAACTAAAAAAEGRIGSDVDCQAVVLHPTAAAPAMDARKQPQGAQQQEQQHQCCQQPQQWPKQDKQSQHDEQGYKAGGYCNSQPPKEQPNDQQHHWGQSLQYLDVVASVQPEDTIQLVVNREGGRLAVHVLGGHRYMPAAMANAADTVAAPGNIIDNAAGAVTWGSTGNSSDNSTISSSNTSRDRDLNSSCTVSVPLQMATRPPWLRSGAGIEDPHVWAVKKCQQLLAQMLQRAPGGKFPPIWQDLALMQVQAGSLGLDAASIGAISQELTMLEALAVASQRHIAVSAGATAEAVGIKPPVLWR